MIRELIGQLYMSLRDVVGYGSVAVLFAASVIVVYLCSGDKRKEIMPVVLSVPVSICCAAAQLFNAVLQKTKKSSLRIAAVIFAAALVLLAIASSGRSMFSRQYATRAENAMHIPQDLPDAMDEILNGNDEAKVLTMPDWELFFYDYSSRFIIAEADTAPEAHKELSDVHPDMRIIANDAKRNGCEYVVLSKGLWPDLPLSKFGYELIYNGDLCEVYREVKAP